MKIAVTRLSDRHHGHLTQQTMPSGEYRSAIDQDINTAINDQQPYSTISPTINKQEGQHPLTGQRAANFRLLANQ